MQKIQIFTDHRGGNLLPLEFENLPFSPKRIFTVTDVPKDGIRGQHAHYETQQILICVKGEIAVSIDDGIEEKESIITEGETFFIDKMVWDSQKFLTGEDIMLVICSTNYDIEDYIFDKSEFIDIVQKNIK